MGKTYYPAPNSGQTKVSGSLTAGGLKTGTFKYYSVSGSLVCQEYYVNGIQSGSWTQWWDDGSVKSQAEYSDAGSQLSKEHPTPLFLEGEGTDPGWISLADRLTLINSSV